MTSLNIPKNIVFEKNINIDTLDKYSQNGKIIQMLQLYILEFKRIEKSISFIIEKNNKYILFIIFYGNIFSGSC